MKQSLRRLELQNNYVSLICETWNSLEFISSGKRRGFQIHFIGFNLTVLLVHWLFSIYGLKRCSFRCAVRGKGRMCCLKHTWSCFFVDCLTRHNLTPFHWITLVIKHPGVWSLPYINLTAYHDRFPLNIYSRENFACHSILFTSPNPIMLTLKQLTNYSRLWILTSHLPIDVAYLCSWLLVVLLWLHITKGQQTSEILLLTRNQSKHRSSQKSQNHQALMCLKAIQLR